MIKGRGDVSPITVAWGTLKTDPLINIREAAETLGAHPCTIRRWVAQKRIPAVRVGGQIKIRQSQALKFIQGE